MVRPGWPEPPGHVPHNKCLASRVYPICPRWPSLRTILRRHLAWMCSRGTAAPFLPQRSYSILSLTLSRHRKPKICLSHPRYHTSKLRSCATVKAQVSQPYSNTEITTTTNTVIPNAQGDGPLAGKRPLPSAPLLPQSPRRWHKHVNKQTNK